MSDVPVQVIVAAFQDEETAKNALKALKELCFPVSRILPLKELHELDALLERCLQKL